MTAITGIDIGKQICEALNIDFHNVRSIIIEIVPDDLVYVKIGRIVINEEKDKIVEVFKHYKLISSDIIDDIKRIE